MTCLSLDEIAALVAGGVDPDSGSGSAAEHVRACGDCRRQVLELREIADLLAVQPARRRGECPEWETLAAYAEGGRGPTASDPSVEEHLGGCPKCLRQVALFRMSDDFQARKLPVRNAVPAAPEKPRFFAGRWLIFVPVVAAVAIAVVLAVLATRHSQRPMMAVLRPPAESPVPGPGSRPDIPQPKSSEPSASGAPVKPQPGSTQSLGESPVLYRTLPGVSPPFSALFRYWSPESSREVLVPVSEALTLHSGDYFSLRISPKFPLWLYVFQEDADGDVSVLFPSAEFGTGSNPVKASDWRVIPSPNRGFQLDRTVGEERVYLFYGSEKIDRCERLLALVGSHSIDSGVRQIIRALVRTAGPRDLSTPGHAAIDFFFRHEP